MISKKAKVKTKKDVPKMNSLLRGCERIINKMIKISLRFTAPIAVKKLKSMSFVKVSSYSLLTRNLFYNNSFSSQASGQ